MSFEKTSGGDYEARLQQEFQDFRRVSEGGTLVTPIFLARFEARVNVLLDQIPNDETRIHWQESLANYVRHRHHYTLFEAHGKIPYLYPFGERILGERNIILNDLPSNQRLPVMEGLLVKGDFMTILHEAFCNCQQGLRHFVIFLSICLEVSQFERISGVLSEYIYEFVESLRKDMQPGESNEYTEDDEVIFLIQLGEMLGAYGCDFAPENDFGHKKLMEVRRLLEDLRDVVFFGTQTWSEAMIDFSFPWELDRDGDTQDRTILFS